MRKLIFILLLFSSFASYSQKNKQDYSVDKLASIIAPDSAINKHVQTIYTYIDTSELNTNLKDTVRAYIDSVRHKSIDSVKKILLSSFTEQEIQKLLSFYNTSLGQKALKFNFELNEILTNYFLNASDEIYSRVSGYDASIDSLIDNEDETDTFPNATPYEHLKNKEAIRMLKSTVMPADFYYNSDEWKSIPPKTLNESAEFSFMHLTKPIYAIAITEASHLSIMSLRKTVLVNLYRVVDSASIFKQEWRMVNGYRMLAMGVKTNISNNDYIYFWYLYSGPFGICQFVAWTDEQSFKINQYFIENILDGIVVNESAPLIP